MTKNELQVNNLNVDLIADQAMIMLNKHMVENGKGKSWNVSINVPVQTPGNQPENRLKQHAIAAAIETLKEAIAALEKFHA